MEGGVGEVWHVPRLAGSQFPNQGLNPSSTVGRTDPVTALEALNLEEKIVSLAPLTWGSGSPLLPQADPPYPKVLQSLPFPRGPVWEALGIPY